MSISVYKIEEGTVKKSPAKIDLPESVEKKGYHEGIVHQVITAYRTRGRQGTRATKGRSQVAGSGAKPWRQKGTGRARAGCRQSPIWRGGGHTFAKTSKDYENSVKVNKKEYRQAIRSIIYQQVKNECVQVVDQMIIDQPKTKAFLNLMSGLNIQTGVFIVSDLSQELVLSSRNIPNVSVHHVTAINPLMLYSAKKLIIDKVSMEKIMEYISDA